VRGRGEICWVGPNASCPRLLSSTHTYPGRMLALCVISGLRTLLPSTEMGINCETVLVTFIIMNDTPNFVDMRHNYLSVRPFEFLFLFRQSFNLSPHRGPSAKCNYTVRYQQWPPVLENSYDPEAIRSATTDQGERGNVMHMTKTASEDE